MKYKTPLIAFICLVALFALHFPFLHSDPDVNLSIGRDAFTDEGLNTSQLRNYINHDYLSFDESDNLIKSPLFNLLLFFPLKFFGTHLFVARLTILISFLLILLLLSMNESFGKIIPALFITTLIQYYVFQYSHFSLAEMLCVALIIAGIFFLFQFLRQQQSSQLLFAAFFLSATYFAKIQFAYVIVLIPHALILAHCLKLSYLTLQNFALCILWLTVFSFIYFINWYLPHWAIFDYVMKNESAQKFAAWSDIPKTVAFNVVHVLFNPQNFIFNSFVVASFLLGIFLWRKSDSSFKIIFLLSILWTMIELHKLAMIYLPSRYLVSYYFAAGFMSSVVLTQAIRKKSATTRFSFFRFAAIVLLALCGIKNGFDYKSLYENRQYSVENINNYFSSTIKNPDAPVMGVWATNATWDCKARCIPVWYNFLNDQNLFERFQPQAILSEPNEDESNGAYSNQDIDLKAMADSTRSFQIGKWAVNVYWIH